LGASRSVRPKRVDSRIQHLLKSPWSVVRGPLLLGQRTTDKGRLTNKIAPEQFAQGRNDPRYHLAWGPSPLSAAAAHLCGRGRVPITGDSTGQPYPRLAVRKT